MEHPKYRSWYHFYWDLELIQFYLISAKGMQLRSGSHKTKNIIYIVEDGIKGLG
jgi:hypothetical protein